MVKVLLTSVFKPFGLDNKLNSRRILPELFEGQITFAQGIFSLRSVLYTWGLDLIASNIKAPTTVMHYPSLKEFVKELKKGYDYVGINFVVATFDKAKIMAKKIREISPETKIIFGGYGTILPEADKIADYVCREEGITFMRRLLNEPEESNKIKFPIKLTRTNIMGFPTSLSIVFPLSLGCPNGCDFCCTSHFYKRKRIPFVKDGKTFYEELVRIEKKTGVIDFGIIDEDFLLQKKFLTEFSKYNSKRKKPFVFSCFGSAKSISMYTPDELIRSGITTIWIGVESKNAHFDKLKNMDVSEMMLSLQKVGINILGSFIVGLFHHNEKTLKADFENFMSLRPTLSQFIISTPHIGTPLYERLKNEGRIFKNIPNKNADGFSLIFKHPNFTPERLSEIQMALYKEDYGRLGPSAFRYIETQFNGYKNLKNSPDPSIRVRAKFYKESCRSVYPLIPAGIRYAPNRKIRKWVRDLSRELYSEFGNPNILERLFSMIVSLKAYYCWQRRNKKLPVNPKLIITRYRVS